MQIEECYQILETPATASPDEIRKSYRTLVNVWHTDRFAGNEPLRIEAQRKLARINEALGVLEAAGFPRRTVLDPASTPAGPAVAVATEPISRPVQRTLHATSIVVLGVIFWIVLDDKGLTERLIASVFAALILGTAITTSVFHLVWSVRSRPRTWIIMVGASLALIALLLDSDPSLGPALLVVGFLGALLLIFVLFYVRSRPTQSVQTRIWNRLIMWGFLAMVGVAALAIILSQPMLALAASWVYWFGWTWISWLIAGRLTRGKG